MRDKAFCNFSNIFICLEGDDILLCDAGSYGKLSRCLNYDRHFSPLVGSPCFQVK